MFCRLVIWFTLTTLITSSAASEVFGDRTGDYSLYMFYVQQYFLSQNLFILTSSGNIIEKC